MFVSTGCLKILVRFDKVKKINFGTMGVLAIVIINEPTSWVTLHTLKCTLSENIKKRTNKGIGQ